MAEEQQQRQQQQTDTTGTATAPASSEQSTPRRRTPQVLVAKMLTMILQNGTALALQRPRLHSVAALNALRTELLLHTPFFDPLHQPAELGPRTRRPPVSFMDIAVLMARLMRVLMKQQQGALTEAERRERVEVRNECLDQPFFDRALVGSARPFGDEEGFMDEGCVV